MSGQPSNTQQISDALAAFRATHSAYLSSSDQATSDLLIALSEAVIALGGDAGHAPQANQSAIGELQSQIDMLQRVVRSQESELQRLRDQQGRQRSIAATSSVEPPRVMRPAEYWAENLPDYGDNLTPEQALQHLNGRRVRPEDVVLTPEDIARNTRRKPKPDMSPESLRAVSLLIYVLVVLVLLGWIFMTMPR